MVLYLLSDALFTFSGDEAVELLPMLLSLRMRPGRTMAARVSTLNLGADRPFTGLASVRLSGNIVTPTPATSSRTDH